MGIVLSIIALASNVWQANSLPEEQYFTPELKEGAMTERLEWYGKEY